MVDVERVIIDARVVDDSGAPLPGLLASDFKVLVEGRKVDVESVHWVPADLPAQEEGAVSTSETPAAAPSEGRLLVFFFQKDLESSRIAGLLRMQHEALRLARGLPARDRIAVVSFDTRLHLWLDFTTDRDLLARVLDESVLFGRPVRGEAQNGPLLATAFSPVAARAAASPEQALKVIADSLQDVPGPKSLVLFGWGMGRWSPGFGVSLEPVYDEARAGLTRARVAVFALDITDADYHSLEAGLQQVAADTGGFYARTHVFTGQAMQRLAGALAGHYEITIVKPALPTGEHEVDVRLVRGRKGTVLARTSYSG